MLGPCLTSRTNLSPLEIIEAPIWVFDVDRHRMWWANEAGLRFWQAPSLSDLLARDYSNDSSSVRRRLRTVVDEVKPGHSTLDRWTLYPGNDPVPVDLRLTPIQIGRGRRNGLIIEAAVVDEASALADLDSRTLEAMRYSPVMISYYAPNGALISMNARARDVFGRARDTNGSQAKSPPDQAYLQQRMTDRDVAEDLLAACNRGDEPSGTFQVETPAGRRWHRMTLRMGRDPVTGNHAVIVVEEDITSLKDAVGALERQNRMLHHRFVSTVSTLEEAQRDMEQAKNVKHDFLARMTHDLRTPLNAILGFSEMISSESMQEPSIEKYRQYGEHIYTAAGNLLAMIDDLLDLSRAESGQLPVHPESIAIVRLVEESLAFFSNRFRTKNIDLAFDPPPEFKIVSDRRALFRILMNVLSNAVKFTPQYGKVEITLDPDDCSDAISIIVSDSGRGIPEETLSSIFEPYFQGDAEIVTEGMGSGLGLPICKRLADLIGAEIEIASELYVGTSVELRVPRTLPDLQATDD